MRLFASLIAYLKPAAVVIGIILVLDLALAQILKRGTEFWAGTYPHMDHRVRSADYHHTFAPGREVIERWGRITYRFATNSLGFKDAAPRAVKAKRDGPRLLLLGDSFTEGAGYGFPETFAGRIAAAMDKNGVEVLNAAVGSYAPIIYNLKTRYLLDKVGLQFDHVVIFLDVSDIYDEAKGYRTDARGRLIVPPETPEKTSRVIGHFLRDNSMIGRAFTLIRDQLSGARKALKLRWRAASESGESFFSVSDAALQIYAITDKAAGRWTYDDEAWRDHGADGRQKAAGQLDRLFTYLKNRKIPMTLAIYPWPDQILFDPEAPRHLGFWRDWAAARGIQFIDLFAAFTDGASVETLLRYFIAGDFHWNEQGHALTAAAFLRQFKD